MPTLDAIDEIRRGRMVVVVDDEDRENEGDLTIAAEYATPEVINFMALYGRGLICLALTGERCEQLDLPMMSRDNSSRFGTAFCESIDAREGTSSGISAQDRARTIQQVIDPGCLPVDLSRPGHMFPLRARDWGVLEREGQTEAAVDLARLAGLRPAGVICEIMNPDGTMARVPQLREFCRTHGLLLTSVADLISYRLETERLVKRLSEAPLETPAGTFRAVTYRNVLDEDVHVAVVRGDVGGNSGGNSGSNPGGDQPVPVHVHSRCLPRHELGNSGCHCEESIGRSLHDMADAGAGVLIWLQRRIGTAYRAAAEHERAIVSQILSDLGASAPTIAGGKQQVRREFSAAR